MASVSNAGTAWSPPSPPPAPEPPPSEAGAGAPPSWTALRLAAGAFLLGAAVLHVVGLFPSLGTGAGSQSATASSVVLEAILAAGWLAAAAFLLAGRARPAAAGAGLAIGLALAEAGIVLSNVASTFSATTVGPGTWLIIASWAAGAAGAVLAVSAAPARTLGSPGRPGHRELVPLTAIAAVVLGYALLPAWDRYALDLAAIGEVKVERLGSAFAAHTATGVVAGDLIAAVMFAAVPILAVLWRPGRLGTFLTGGVLVVVVAQLASAVAGFQITNPDYFASSGEVRALDLSVQSSALTVWFDIEVVAALALLVLVVARWWTPDGGSLLASYPTTGLQGSDQPWTYGHDPTRPGYWMPPGAAPLGTTAAAPAHPAPPSYGAPPWGYGPPSAAPYGHAPAWGAPPVPPGAPEPPEPAGSDPSSEPSG